MKEVVHAGGAATTKISLRERFPTGARCRITDNKQGSSRV